MIVILGTGGHARAMMEKWRLSHWWPFAKFRMTNDDRDVPKNAQVVIGVGDVDDRRRLYKQFRSQIGTGLQIMPGAIVYASATLGVNVLVNTGAQIDHDCNIGDHCVIGPGAILCGGVRLGEACAIGAGAIILQGVTLEAETKVPAGTLVVAGDEWRYPVKR